MCGEYSLYNTTIKTVVSELIKCIGISRKLCAIIGCSSLYSFDAGSYGERRP